jgi:hypothetical protein
VIASIFKRRLNTASTFLRVAGVSSKLASKQTYECFVCKKNGFADTRVYSDGKTEDGKTVYKNPDMSPHVHKEQQQNQQSNRSTTVVTTVTRDERIMTLLSELNIKMTRVIEMLDEQGQK